MLLEDDCKVKSHQPFIFGAAHHPLGVLLVITKQQRPMETILMCELTQNNTVPILIKILV